MYIMTIDSVLTGVCAHTYCCAGSGEFNAAISDIKHFFPSGVLCDPCTLVADYGVSIVLIP